MTCIVGLEHNGYVYMGGDRAASTPTNLMVSSVPKIFKKATAPYRRHTETVLIGFAGAFLMANTIQYKFQPPAYKTSMSVDEYIHTIFTDELKKITNDNQYDPNNDPAWLMIAMKDKLFSFQEDFSILQNQCGYATIGSGSDYALGALHILTSQPFNNANDVIKTALETSAVFSPAVCAPFDFLSTKK